MAAYKQPCDDAIRMDKEIAVIMERQANDRDEIIETRGRVDQLENQVSEIKLKNAKSTAFWSAVGSAVSVVLVFALKWLMTKGS